MTTLPLGFKLCKATQDELGEIWEVLKQAYALDENWVIMFQSVKPADIHPWLMANFAPRWQFPDITTFVIKEDATEYVIREPARSFINQRWKTADDLPAK